MKENNLFLIVLGIIALLVITMIPWGGNSGWGLCTMMGNWNYGSGGYGLGRIISWLTNIALFVLIILGIIWLIKNITDKTRK